MILIDKSIPEDCDYCFCNDDYYRCGLLNEEFPLHLSGRLPNCPLREMEKVDDTISRQAAIDGLSGHYVERTHLNDWQIGWNDALEWVKDTYLKGLPSAQPEPHWIPCSDTVDIPEHEVLCCDKYGEELIGWLSCEDDQWICESDGEMMYDPIAWRELPEPWRGEEHG